MSRKNYSINPEWDRKEYAKWRRDKKRLGRFISKSGFYYLIPPTAERSTSAKKWLRLQRPKNKFVVANKYITVGHHQHIGVVEYFQKICFHYDVLKPKIRNTNSILIENREVIFKYNAAWYHGPFKKICLGTRKPSVYAPLRVKLISHPEKFHGYVSIYEGTALQVNLATDRAWHRSKNSRNHIVNGYFAVLEMYGDKRNFFNTTLEGVVKMVEQGMSNVVDKALKIKVKTK